MTKIRLFVFCKFLILVYFILHLLILAVPENQSNVNKKQIFINSFAFIDSI